MMKFRQVSVSPRPTMIEDEPLQVLELVNRIVSKVRCLSSFVSLNTKPYVSCLDHVDVVGSIAN